MRFLLGFLGGALAVLALSPASTRFTASARTASTGARTRTARRASARTRTAEEAARGRQRLAAYYRIHLN